MAAIRHMTQTYNRSISKFLGVNESPTGENSLKSGEAESMQNYRITLDGKLETRPGALDLWENTFYATWDGLHRDGRQLKVSVGDGRREIDLGSGLLAIPSCWADLDGLDTVYINGAAWPVEGDVSARKKGPLYLKASGGALSQITEGQVLADYPYAASRLHTGGKPVQCIWTGYLNGREVCLAASTAGLYQLTTENNGGSYALTRIGDIGAAGATSMFGFQNKVWILNGEEYWCWDGTNAPAPVEGYVPLVITAAAPSGGGTELEGLNLLSDRYRAQYSPDGESNIFYLPVEGTPGIVSVTLNGEDINIGYHVDTKKNCVLFSAVPPKGVNTLEITAYMPLKENGRVTTEDTKATSIGLLGQGGVITGYAYAARFPLGKDSGIVGLGPLTVEYSDSTSAEVTWDYCYGFVNVIVADGSTTSTSMLEVYFNTASGTMPDSATIYGYLPGSLDTQREIVEKMKYGVLFNGNTDGRVFLYGDGSYTCIYSGLDENGVPRADYFPALNQANIGTSNSPIRSMVRHYNALLAFKPDEAYRITYGTESLADGRAIAGFSIRPVHSTIGSAGYNQAALVYNNPRTLHRGSVFEWRLNYYTSSANRDERNAKRISDRVKRALSAFSLENCLVFDDEANYEYWIVDPASGDCIVNNYAVDAWYLYHFTDTSATCMARFHGDLLVGNEDGRIQTLRAGANMDGYPGSFLSFRSRWLGALFDAGHDYLSKWTIDQYVGLQNLDGNSALVSAQTDRQASADERTVEAKRTAGRDGEWGGATATVHHIKRRTKGWAFLRTALRNQPGLPSTVISLNTNYRLGTGGRRT